MKGNRGFSLVEIIVVIAIISVLTGIIAPQLIKYAEKAKVSADIQLCDTVRTAVILMLSEPKIAANTDIDATTQALVTQLTTPGASGSFSLYAVSSNNFMAYDYLNDITGINVFTTTSGQFFKSNPARTNGVLSYKVSEEGLIYIFINHSDNSGEKNDYFVNSNASVSDLGNLICAPVAAINQD